MSDAGYTNLRHLHDRCKQLGEPSIDDLLETIRKVLTQVRRNVYIMIDALDESLDDSHPAPSRGHDNSPRNLRRQVLRTLSRIRSWQIPTLHLLVSSCNEPYIREQLSPGSNEELPVDTSAIQDDIGLYIDGRLQEKDFDELTSSKARIKMVLLRNASGSFRWVECQLDEISECVQSELGDVLSSLPRGLDESYERILMKIQPRRMKQVESILTWLCFSRHPLTVKVISDILTIQLKDGRMANADSKQGTVFDLLRMCVGLITIPEGRDSLFSTVHIAHFSVQQYLESRARESLTVSQFHLDRRAANTDLAKASITYLMREDFKVKDQNSFTIYAATFWQWHYLHGCPKEKSLNSLVFKLLTSTAFANLIRLGLPNKNPHSVKIYPRFSTPLIYASFYGLEVPTRALLRLDSLRNTINEKNRMGETALFCASHEGHKSIVRLLLDYHADVNAGEGFSGSPLIAASSEGHEGVARLLLKNGADINQEGGKYGNALQAASACCHEEVMQLLSEWGANNGLVRSRKDAITIARITTRSTDGISRCLILFGAAVAGIDDSKRVKAIADMTGPGILEIETSVKDSKGDNRRTIAAIHFLGPGYFRLEVDDSSREGGPTLLKKAKFLVDTGSTKFLIVLPGPRSQYTPASNNQSTSFIVAAHTRFTIPTYNFPKNESARNRHESSEIRPPHQASRVSEGDLQNAASSSRNLPRYTDRPCHQPDRHQGRGQRAKEVRSPSQTSRSDSGISPSSHSRHREDRGRDQLSRIPRAPPSNKTPPTSGIANPSTRPSRRRADRDQDQQPRENSPSFRQVSASCPSNPSRSASGSKPG